MDTVSNRKVEEVIKQHKKELEKRFKIKEIGIFGSYVRGEQKKASDIDILVEMELECQTFRNYMGLKFFLEKILGNKVDLVLKDTIKEQLKDRILGEVVSV
ncbi:nucleotidyltransferase family protein [candidate division WOR-3 bacterium]|nr:nucleotidyltransferase family protein [candidate division WOR-3 bacterium]